MKGTSILWTVADAAVMTGRNVKKYLRLPQLLIFTLVQPVIIVLLFAYVFGGAMRIPGIKYVDFVLPGIFIQTLLFGSTVTGVALADDLSKGMVDRFRSLPMARSAVLAGRTISDTIRNAFVVGLVFIVGTLIGFRFHAGVIPFIAGLGLVVLFGFAFSWISAAIGIAIGEAEAAQAASFVWLFPLVFASSAFVPVQTMPAWLQSFAELSPITSAVDSMRALSLGGPTAEPVLKTLAWIGGILALFVPLAVYRYRRT